jgi:hypothetical protein
MAKAIVISCLGILVSLGCNPAPPAADAALEQRLQAIESGQAALQRQVEGATLKSQVTSGLLFRSPLQDFFASPEFWEQTYDSGQADCARRCIRANQEHRAACAKLPAGAAQARCYDDALQRVTACQRGCAGL